MFFAAVLQRTTALIESKTAEGSSAGVLAHFRCDVGATSLQIPVSVTFAASCQNASQRSVATRSETTSDRLVTRSVNSGDFEAFRIFQGFILVGVLRLMEDSGDLSADFIRQLNGFVRF